MPIPAFPSVPVTGYTSLNIIGCHNLQTEVMVVPTLAADVTLTAAQAYAIGIFEVTVGHATNAIIIPAANVVVGNSYFVVNNDATLAASIKVAGGTAVTIAATKAAQVYITSAGQVKRLTPDA